jgi:hypothetical protein
VEKGEGEGGREKSYIASLIQGNISEKQRPQHYIFFNSTLKYQKRRIKREREREAAWRRLIQGNISEK